MIKSNEKTRTELYNLRKDLNLTQKEMADKIGIQAIFYSKIERGEKNPSLKTLKKIKKAFPNLDIANIFLQ